MMMPEKIRFWYGRRPSDFAQFFGGMLYIWAQGNKRVSIQTSMPISPNKMGFDSK